MASLPRLARILAGVAAFALSACPALASDSLPVAQQASIYRKIFTYDPALASLPRIKVLVVHGRVSSAQAREVAGAFEEAGVPAVPSDVEAVTVAEPGTVLYVLADVPNGPLRELAVAQHLLTISGDAESVEQGRVSVALRRRPDGSAEILASLSRLRREGHELSARVLKLATVLP